MALIIFVSAFVLFLHIVFLRVWWKTEVLPCIVIPPVDSTEDDNSPPREWGHVETTRDLNCCLQSFAIAVQQRNSVQPLTGYIDTDTL